MIDLGGDGPGHGSSTRVCITLAAGAEAARARSRERVAGVKADQRARGRYLGGIVPFGYVVGAEGALEARPDQQAAIARMRDLRRAGGSLRFIAAEMRLAGHSLSHEGVKGILTAAAMP